MNWNTEQRTFAAVALFLLAVHLAVTCFAVYLAGDASRSVAEIHRRLEGVMGGRF